MCSVISHYAVRPVINIPEKEVLVREEGNDVTIECYIEAYPRGITYWESRAGLFVARQQSQLLPFSISPIKRDVNPLSLLF